MFLRQAMVAGIGLYTSRVVLHELGVTDFGVYNLIGGIVALFSFLNSALSSATQRHLSYELGRGDIAGLHRHFNASILLHLIIALVAALLAESIGRRVLFHHLDIPATRMAAAGFIFHVSVATFSVSILQVPFRALTISHERMSFFAYLGIFEAGAKLAAAFALQWWSGDKLVAYAWLVAGSAAMVMLLNAGFCWRSFPECRISFRGDRRALGNMAAFSSWTLFGSIAVVFRTQISALFLNWFGSVRANAAMGVTNQLANTLNSVAANFQVAFTPQLTKAFARGDKSEIVRLLSQTSRLSYLMFFTVSLPFLVATPFILNLWLGSPPPDTETFCRLTLVQLLVEAVSAPLWICVQASGDIRRYQVVVGFAILSNLPISYLALRFGAPIWSPIAIGATTSTGLYAFRLAYAGRAFGFPVKEYLSSVGKSLSKVTFASLVAPAILGFMARGPYAPPMIAIVAGASALLSSLAWGLTDSERQTLVAKIRRILPKGISP